MFKSNVVYLDESMHLRAILTGHGVTIMWELDKAHIDTH